VADAKAEEEVLQWYAGVDGRAVFKNDLRQVLHCDELVLLGIEHLDLVR
jgi:hypothetical protein